MIAERALLVVATAAALGLGALAITQTLRLAHATTQLAAERAARAQEREGASAAALTASETYRLKERAWRTSQQEIVDAAQQDAARSRADAGAAGAVAVRLQQHAAELAARCGGATGDPAAAAGGPPAAGPGLVLAELLRRSDEHSGKLAEYADEARIAGTACERAYDALR